MKGWRRLGALFAIIRCWPAAALAVEPDEIIADPQLEARARALSSEFRCLVCQNQSIAAQTDAPLAKDLRILIRERLKAGASDSEVRKFMVERYGDFVLLRPRLTVETLLLWFTPFALLLVGLIFAIRAGRRRETASAADAALSEEERRRPEDWLARNVNNISSPRKIAVSRSYPIRSARSTTRNRERRMNKLPTSRRRTVSALAIAGLLGATSLATITAFDHPTSAIAQTAITRAPAEGFGDLVEKVMPAVVSVEAKLGVQTSANIQGGDDEEQSGLQQMPDLPPDSPFRQFFEQFPAGFGGQPFEFQRPRSWRGRVRASSSPMTVMSSPTTMW